MKELIDRFAELEAQVSEFDINPQVFKLITEMCAISALLDIQEAMRDG